MLGGENNSADTYGVFVMVVQIQQADSSQASQTSVRKKQLFLQARAHLLDRLRAVFDASEQELLEAGEQVSMCCGLRRHRRPFVDNYLDQLWQYCENPQSEWLSSRPGSSTHSRTMLYLAEADRHVRELCQEYPVEVGRVAAIWSQQTGLACSALDCPFSPHTFARLFFFLLPDLPVPLRIRYVLAKQFVLMQGRLLGLLHKSFSSFAQHAGTGAAGLEPLLLPEWWIPLERQPQASVIAQALIVPSRFISRVTGLACEIADAALEENYAVIPSIMEGQRQTSVLPWLLSQLHGETSHLPEPARQVLALLAGPLLQATCDESFADPASPARRVLEEWCHWAPGWQRTVQVGADASDAVSEYCFQLARTLSELLTQQPDNLMSGWQVLLDYLLELRKNVQKDTAVVVASTRISLQVIEVRAEVEALLAGRAALERWPLVVVEILREAWTSLLLSIHWHEGTASDAWLQAIAVADDLLASVQPGADREAYQRQMMRAPKLLQGLRKGFEAIGCDWRTYSPLLDRLERVHFTLLRAGADNGGQLPESLEFWPPVIQLPGKDEPFDVGSWVRRSDGLVMSVEFSDPWCTVLLNAHNAELECCATAALHADYYDGELVVLPASATLLQLPC